MECETVEALEPGRKGKSHRHSFQAVKAAIIEASGSISGAAKALGLHRSSLWLRIQKDERLERVLHQAREELVDLAESKLKEAIEDGAPWAISLALKTLGKGRGYVERVETEDKSPAPANPWEGKTDDEIREVIREAVKAFFPNGLDYRADSTAQPKQDPSLRV